MSWSFYKCDPRAAYDGTRFLTLEQRGAYRDILDLMYIHDGPLPDKPEFFGPALGVSKRKWTAIRNALLSLGKIVCDDGYLWNERALKEIENRSKTSRKLSENRAKTSRKSHENSSKNAELETKDLENNDLASSSNGPGSHSREDIRYKIIDNTPLPPSDEREAEIPSPEVAKQQMDNALTCNHVQPEVSMQGDTILLTDKKRNQWMSEFELDADQLRLALIQAVTWVQGNSPTPLETQVRSQLARITGNRKYYSNLKQNKHSTPLDREEQAIRAFMEEMKRKYLPPERRHA